MIGRFSRALTLAPFASSSLHDVRGVELVDELRRRPAQHRPHRVHVDRGIQRRRAGAVGDVGIGALLDQHGGRVEMRVDDRVHQRRRAVGIRGD